MKSDLYKIFKVAPEDLAAQPPFTQILREHQLLIARLNAAIEDDNRTVRKLLGYWVSELEPTICVAHDGRIVGLAWEGSPDRIIVPNDPEFFRSMSTRLRFGAPSAPHVVAQRLGSIDTMRANAQNEPLRMRGYVNGVPVPDEIIRALWPSKPAGAREKRPRARINEEIAVVCVPREWDVKRTGAWLEAQTPAGSPRGWMHTLVDGTMCQPCPDHAGFVHAVYRR